MAVIVEDFDPEEEVERAEKDWTGKNRDVWPTEYTLPSEADTTYANFQQDDLMDDHFVPLPPSTKYVIWQTGEQG